MALQIISFLPNLQFYTPSNVSHHHVLPWHNNTGTELQNVEREVVGVFFFLRVPKMNWGIPELDIMLSGDVEGELEQWGAVVKMEVRISALRFVAMWCSIVVMARTGGRGGKGGCMGHRYTGRRCPNASQIQKLVSVYWSWIWIL